ncbi:hypothetical protein NPIL_529811 [Nephila pilipes]|uniref:Uncharacterized protein n=1 Tax=Nephila pilipes TaxID=299642 RepID=A0A8X6Q2U2_NEPPI|nr:hypothetical protein NPIL_529811 [Nephila pilipes]
MLLKAEGEVRESVLVQFKKRFSNIENNSFYAMASLLNPPFKNSKLSPAASSSREDDFWEDLHKMVQDNWKVRKKSKLLEEFDTSNLHLAA